MCAFCENIKTKNEYANKPFWERNTCILKDGEIYGLWVESEDSYLSRIIMNVNYCPKCGRELNPNYRLRWDADGNLY